ncbi:MAG TPA: WD40 repeat domain-containing protein [Gemmataceae bacterium]|nr:WD40 repeat domain-containing protein [Gemmataceae bacterium]
MSTFYHRLISAFALTLGLLTAATSVVAQSARTAEPPNNKQPRRDRFGDALPEGAIYRVGSSRFRVGNWVDFLAYSPDGKTLLSINRSNYSAAPLVRHWEVASGAQRCSFSLSQGNGNSRAVYKTIAASPDGKLLAVPFALVDAATGRLVRGFGMKKKGQVIAFSSDGRALATGDDKGTIELWEPTSGRSLGTLEVSSPPSRAIGFSQAIAFSPDGKLVTAAHIDHTVRIWDRATRRLIRRLQPAKQDAVPQSIAFSPDGKRIAAYCDDKIVLWNTATGEQVRTLPLGSSWYLGLLAFSPDGKFLAASHLDKIRLWEMNNGKEVRQLKQPRCPTSLAFSPDGKVLATGDENIHLWQVATGERIRPGGDTAAEIASAAFSPDGRFLATGGQDEFIRLWDANTGAPIRRFKACPGGNPSVGFSLDGKSIFSQDRHQFVLWDSVTNKEVRRFQAPASALTATLSPSGRTLAWVDRKRTAHFQDIASDKESRTWKKEKGRRIDLSQFSSPEERLTAIALFNAPDYGGLHRDGEKEFPPFQKDGQFAGFSSDGRIVARLDGTGRIHFQDTATAQDLACTHSAAGEPLAKLPSMALSAFSPDGKTFAAQTTRGPIRLWETATGKERYRSPIDIGWLESMTFSPAGDKLMSVSSEKTALVWQLFGPPPEQRPPELSTEQLRSLWSDLARDDGRIAFRALQMLTAGSPRPVVDFLRREMLAAPRLDPRRIARWIAELDADQFAVREKATAELKKLGVLVVGRLRQALQEQPTPEARRRLEGLLGEMKEQAAAPETIRAWRVIEVLEHMATPDARRLLEQLAGGEPDARLTPAAKASLARLAGRPHGKP